jgi:hypothetical protein
MKFHSTFLLVLMFALHAGCGDGSSSSAPVVPSEGTYAWLQANIDERDTLQLAASVYKDGEKADLVGGDVIHATQGAQAVRLKGVALRSGDYAGVISGANDAEQVVFSVDYEPEESRDDRWYPHDILRVDPGAGPLVGLQAAASIPPRVEILAPAANTTVTGRNSEFELAWTAAATDDEMRLAGYVTCHGNGSPLSYAVSYGLGADDGAETLSMLWFIPNESLLEFADVLITSLVRILVEAMFDALLFGLVDPDFDNVLPTEIDHCDIDLVLLRERETELAGDFDNGLVVGSSSASVQIVYQPGE